MLRTIFVPGMPVTQCISLADALPGL